MEIIRPKTKDLGSFDVRRLLPSSTVEMVGPWVFFDHIGPAYFRAGKGIDVRPHPHINLATVTYLFDGELMHRDSLGSCQVIEPGAINLMVAGSGITHSERATEKTRNQSHNMHAVQLWHALPEELEEMDPEFHHYAAADIPEFRLNDAKVRLLIGSAFGHTSPVKTFCETLYMEVTLPKDAIIETPFIPEVAAYAVDGDITINEERIPYYSLAALPTNEVNQIKAISDSKLIIIGGEPLGHRYMEWNFISSRKERIKEAKKQWRNFEFPKVVGDEKEFIPLPTTPRKKAKT